MALSGSLLRKLDEHWFKPARLEDLALARIVLVAMELLLLLVPPLAMSGGGACKGCSLPYQRIISAADPQTYDPVLTLKLLLAPLGWGARPSPMLVQAIWVLAVGSGFTALIGLLTNASLLVFAYCTTVLTAHAYAYGEVRHPEAVLIIALWALALAPSGATRSVDAKRRRRATSSWATTPPGLTLSPHARWPLRLIQWVLALAYLSAGYSKLRDGGIYWFNGYTLAFDVAYDSMARGGNHIGIWIAQYPRVLQLFSIGAVAIELGFWLILVFPALAWIILFAAAGLHLGIYIFQWSSFPQYLALYVVFIDDLRTAWPMRLIAARSSAAGASA